MGHGAKRELSTPTKTDRELSEEDSAAIGRALAKFDQVDEEFREAREDQLRSQRSIMWSDKTGVMETKLRELTKVFVKSHQLSLDCGVVGGGIGARPFLEETSHKFEKLEFVYDEGSVEARVEGDTLGTVPVEQCDIDWMQKMAVKWVLHQVERRV